MAEFNPDGSIKLPSKLSQKIEKENYRMQNGRCIKVRKDVVSYKAPKKCMLKITLSNGITDARFVSNIYAYFAAKADVPTKFSKVNDKEFNIEIGTDFRRCTDCCKLVRQYREFLDGNLIEDKGTCTFTERHFYCQEDYE